LTKILDPLYNVENKTFEFPIQMAIDHLNTSLQNYKNYNSSITFAVIGLESIYKKCIKKENMSNMDVARFAGLLLGIVSNHFEPKEVNSEIVSAYNTRNNWVHGGTPSGTTSHKHQKELWDYLRCSIILFSFLKYQGAIRIDSLLEVDDALIDLDERMNLERELSDFRFLDYLYLERNICDKS
jgi:hypothetical protein